MALFKRPNQSLKSASPAIIKHDRFSSDSRSAQCAANIQAMNSMIRGFAFALLVALPGALHAAEYPAPTEGDYVIHDFKFTSGETLPELKIHYRTIGKA